MSLIVLTADGRAIAPAHEMMFRERPLDASPHCQAWLAREEPSRPLTTGRSLRTTIACLFRTPGKSVVLEGRMGFNRLCGAVGVAIWVSLLSTSTPAQWLTTPHLGFPTPDGKPNLSAPAPRAADVKPDFRESERRGPLTASTSSGSQTEDIQPWAEARFVRASGIRGRTSLARCLPSVSLPQFLHLTRIVNTRRSS